MPVLRLVQPIYEGRESCFKDGVAGADHTV